MEAMDGAGSVGVVARFCWDVTRGVPWRGTCLGRRGGGPTWWWPAQMWSFVRREALGRGRCRSQMEVGVVDAHGSRGWRGREGGKSGTLGWGGGVDVLWRWCRRWRHGALVVVVTTDESGIKEVLQVSTTVASRHGGGHGR